MGRVGVVLKSTEEMQSFGRRVGSLVSPGDVLLLYGDLGAGKTTFVKGVASALGVESLVQSPTFTYLNVYEGKFPFYHFDLYRMKNAHDFFSMGFDEYLGVAGVALIEWAERLEGFFPDISNAFYFLHEKEEERICYYEERWDS
ncbi:MAG TPA: tRNA (adenosine(37)-N6)-threonylcarbamoyltransferase complex ATPase subunit type 1 TsaE [Chlamydiales bacterium]|nr:tRNA (adenosine(37)-N6)-threonylcarbamoyltransferase complex ATPase subunit type 1 TsaE [Chlamydiales bacterium]